jgi:hypothetical protein
VTEVLRIAVKIGSAIETAHRAGVLQNRPTSCCCSPPTAIRVPSDFGIRLHPESEADTSRIGGTFDSLVGTGGVDG